MLPTCETLLFRCSRCRKSTSFLMRHTFSPYFVFFHFPFIWGATAPTINAWTHHIIRLDSGLLFDGGKLAQSATMTLWSNVLPLVQNISTFSITLTPNDQNAIQSLDESDEALSVVTVNKRSLIHIFTGRVCCLYHKHSRFIYLFFWLHVHLAVASICSPAVHAVREAFFSFQHKITDE